MHMLERSFSRRGTQRLPAASLVLDVRGTGSDELVERVKTEISDLVEEMSMHQVFYWSRLSDILAFERIEPLSESERESIHIAQQAPPSGPTAPVLNEFGTEDRPVDAFQRSIDLLNKKIEIIRTHSIDAVEDPNFAGTGNKNATVNIIFLTDAEKRESLATAALYAAHLKEYAYERSRLGYPLLLHTRVICLGSSNESEPAKDLVQGLLWNDSWDHIDTLILTEKYRRDAALLAGETLAELAALLLYVLLTLPPIMVDERDVPVPTHVSLDSDIVDNSQPGQWFSLPCNTIVVGLASVEYSARWGRRWLNYSLARKAIEVLQDDTPENDPVEQSQVKHAIASWLSSFRGQIRAAIPAAVSTHTVALSALTQAENVAKPIREAFTRRSFTPNVGTKTLHGLRAYLSALERAHILTDAERNEVPQSEQLAGKQMAAIHTLEEARDSLPEIRRSLLMWEGKEKALKQGNVLADALIEAQQVLVHPTLFSGASGMFPRALMQLTELSSASAKFQREHEQDQPNLQEMRRELKECGDRRIHALQEHIKQWPVLGTIPVLRYLMMTLTIFLTLLLLGVTTVVSVVWLDLVAAWIAPSLASLLESSATVTTFSVVIALLVPTLLIMRYLVRKRETGLIVEACFLLALFLAGLTGLFTVSSASSLADDPLGELLMKLLVHLLDPLQALSEATLILAFIVVCIEGIFSLLWLRHLWQERERIVKDLQAQHESNIGKVASYIADGIALHLLKHAELTDGMGETGKYYERIGHLDRTLQTASQVLQEQQELAKRYLKQGIHGSTGGTNGNQPLVHIRQQCLNTVPLDDGYNTVSQRLVQEHEDIREFAEMLLRVMSTEKLADIGRQFEGRPTNGHINRFQRRIQTLITTCVVMALRFATEPPASGSMHGFIDLYKQMEVQDLSRVPTLGSLIRMLDKKLQEVALEPAKPEMGNGATYATLSTRARQQHLPDLSLPTGVLAVWGQTLWDGKESSLSRLLDEGSVLSRLSQCGQSPVEIMDSLRNRVSPSGRPLYQRQEARYFLLIDNEAVEGTQFCQQVPGSHLPQTITFPDAERVLLLCVQPYAAEPWFRPNPPAPQALPPGSSQPTLPQP